VPAEVTWHTSRLESARASSAEEEVCDELPARYLSAFRACPFRTSTQPTRSWRRPATRAALWILAVPVSSSSGWRSARRQRVPYVRTLAGRRPRTWPPTRSVTSVCRPHDNRLPAQRGRAGWIDEVIASKDW